VHGDDFDDVGGVGIYALIARGFDEPKWVGGDVGDIVSMMGRWCSIARWSLGMLRLDWSN
jgi:hypothetical protein